MQLPNTARMLLAAAGIAAAAMTGTASAQSTFTYQGVLESNGSPVDGTTVIDFRLFDAETGGSQVGSTLTEILSLDNGVFSADLDFGVAPFEANQELWLEIQIQTDVLPRQKLNPAPFALNTRGINVSGTGRVGIGTTNQQDILHVSGNNARILTESTSGFFSGIRSRVAGKEFFTGVDTFPGAANGGAGWHVFDNTGSGRLLALLPNGNFGVGISIPQSRLHVNGGGLFDGNVGIGTTTPDADVSILVQNPTDRMLGFTEDPAQSTFWFEADFAGSGGDNAVQFKTNQGGGNIMSWKGNGNVGIGNANPNFPLTIESDPSGNSIGLGSNAGGSDWHFDFDGGGLQLVESGVASRVRFKDGGGVFVGDGIDAGGRSRFGFLGFPEISATVDIVGRAADTFALVVEDPSGIFRFSVNNNGDVATQCGIICASDERLKDDITNLDTPLDKIMALRSVSFTWKDETLAKRGTQLGFVAQEVQQVLPELIGETPDGMLGVDYASLTSVLTGAVQEQQAEITAMQEQIAALQGQMESMQAQRSVVGASMVWPVLLGGGVLGGLAVARRRHMKDATKA